ncbi:hypothetical protein [Pedobacter sp. NJ-S-72]
MISKYFALDIGRDSQSQFAMFKGQRNHGDVEIQKVQDHIEKNYENKITIESLATLINISRRTFERRFKEATNNTNEVISAICPISSKLEGEKKWANDVETCLPTRVGHDGLEPSTKRL